MLLDQNLVRRLAVHLTRSCNKKCNIAHAGTSWTRGCPHTHLNGESFDLSEETWTKQETWTCGCPEQKQPKRNPTSLNTSFEERKQQRHVPRYGCDELTSHTHTVILEGSVPGNNRGRMEDAVRQACQLGFELRAVGNQVHTPLPWAWCSDIALRP